MQLVDAAREQPEHSAVVYEEGAVTLQKTVLIDESALGEAFESVPWSRLVFLRCDRQRGGKRLLIYRWRAGEEGWRLPG